jgi:flagellar basal-body rod modification protein FlgD
MVGDTKKIGQSTAVTSAATAGSDLSSFVGSKKNEQISKDQFLQLLVTQLKNQDPLDPMKSEEFAVNLAQFSQLEQLVSINNKIEDKSTDLSSLATYLGQEVVLNSGTVHVDGGDAGHLRVDLPQDADSLEVELLDSEGRVADIARFAEVKKGKQTLALNSVKTGNGDYTFRVKANGVTGTFAVNAQPSGLVTGFVPGPEPKLIVNGNEINPGSIVEVGLPPAQG